MGLLLLARESLAPRKRTLEGILSNALVGWVETSIDRSDPSQVVSNLIRAKLYGKQYACYLAKCENVCSCVVRLWKTSCIFNVPPPQPYPMFLWPRKQTCIAIYTGPSVSCRL